MRLKWEKEGALKQLNSSKNDKTMQKYICIGEMCEICRK